MPAFMTVVLFRGSCLERKSGGFASILIFSASLFSGPAGNMRSHAYRKTGRSN
jgi:hypothetical protein